MAWRWLPSVKPSGWAPPAKEPVSWRSVGVLIASITGIATVAANAAPAGLFAIIGWVPALFFATLALRIGLGMWRRYRGQVDAVAGPKCGRVAVLSIAATLVLPLTFQLADVFALLPLESVALQHEMTELAAQRQGVARLQASSPERMPSGIDEAALTDLKPKAQRLRSRLRYEVHELPSAISIAALQGGCGPWICVAPIYAEHHPRFAEYFARPAYFIGNDGRVSAVASPPGVPPCTGELLTSWLSRVEDITNKPLYEAIQLQPHPQPKGHDRVGESLSITALWFIVYAIPVGLLVAVMLRIFDRSGQVEMIPALVLALILYLLAGASLRWPLAFAVVAVITGAVISWLLRRAQYVFAGVAGLSPLLRTLAWLLPTAWLWGLYAFHDVQDYAGARSLIVDWASRQQALSNLAANPVRQDIYAQRFPALNLDDFRRQQAQFAGPDHGKSWGYRLIVEGDPARGTLVAHLVPTRLPRFPFAHWVGAWSLSADATGALRACRVHAIEQRCPDGLPVLETLTPSDWDYLTNLAQPPRKKP